MRQTMWRTQLHRTRRSQKLLRESSSHQFTLQHTTKIITEMNSCSFPILFYDIPFLMTVVPHPLSQGVFLDRVSLRRQLKSQVATVEISVSLCSLVSNRFSLVDVFLSGTVD